MSIDVVRQESYLSRRNRLGRVRCGEADVCLNLPTNMKIQMRTRRSDVLHAFTLPTLSLKLDRVPGRLNSRMMEMRSVRKIVGQCSELCGMNHSLIPISVEALPLSP